MAEPKPQSASADALLAPVRDTEIGERIAVVAVIGTWVITVASASGNLTGTGRRWHLVLPAYRERRADVYFAYGHVSGLVECRPGTICSGDFDINNSTGYNVIDDDGLSAVIRRPVRPIAAVYPVSVLIVGDPVRRVESPGHRS